MRLTNKAGLPEPLVRAVSNDSYDRGDADFTATELLQPPRARALVKAHRDEIEEDASDRIWALMGQIGHLILERSAMNGNIDGQVVEHRFLYHVQSLGVKVSGRADLINKKLTDYKFTSVWTAKDGVKPEWEQQLNMLAFIAGPMIDIQGAEIVAIYRDWSKPKAQREKDYPQRQVQVFPVKLWTITEQAKFLEDRIKAHTEAQTILPECTDAERWAIPDCWAVKKKGNKKATKLYDNEQAAHAHARAQNLIIEYRPKEYKRCENYCLAAPWCEQYKKDLKRMNEAISSESNAV